MWKLVLSIIALSVIGTAQSERLLVTSVSPASGPEGTRVEIKGSNLGGIRTVRFGGTPALFRINSGTSVIALVPMHAPSGPVTMVGLNTRIESAAPFRVENDPRIPDEVRYKTGYVNILPKPSNFNVVLLWGIVIADTRVPGFEEAHVEIAWTQVSCRLDGREVTLRHDGAKVRGGLYIRQPWFLNNAHEAMKLSPPVDAGASGTPFVTLPVGRRADRIWHFWSASGRTMVPTGHLESCTSRARVRISPGALLQLGMDYWRDSDSLWAPHSKNNYEAGASQWYFPSADWQDVAFTDIPE
jgi:hypothetical protein